MFYNHDILTSREHGVATVWLVATLGSRSVSQKINRKAIMDVDVPRACGTVANPEAPMALRLQGNLLYGISRVYNQQCGYALTDAQTTKEKMRTMLSQINRNATLDPNAGKSRKNQLVIPDDPSFVPSLMLPDVSLLNLISNLEVQPRLHESSLLQSSVRSGGSLQQQPNVNISSSDIFQPSSVGIRLASDMGTAGMDNSQHELPIAHSQEQGILLEPAFGFDEEGNLIDLPVQRQTPQVEVAEGDERGHDLMLHTPLNRMSLPFACDAFPFEAGDQQIQDPKANAEPPADDHHYVLNHSENLSFRNQAVASDSQVQPQLRSTRRRIRPMIVDERPELHNSDLAAWNAEYTHNMAATRKVQAAAGGIRAATIAKRNAQRFVLGSGIGAVGEMLESWKSFHPLAIISGQELLDAIRLPADRKGMGAGQKRDRSRVAGGDGDDDYHESPESARNTRARVETDDNHQYDVNMKIDDIEIGRHAPSSMHEDRSSQMPWNSSVRGGTIKSRHFVPDGANAGASVSVSSHPLSSLVGTGTGRSGRLTSVSPLAGRGALDPLYQDQLMDDELALDYGHDMNMQLDFDGSLVHGRGDHDDVGWKSMEQPQPADSAPAIGWFSDVFEQESANFLAFVRDKVTEAYEANASTSASDRTIAFSSLISPAVNSRIVATRAIMHVLMLAMMGTLGIEQEKEGKRGREDGFGEIFIKTID